MHRFMESVRNRKVFGRPFVNVERQTTIRAAKNTLEAPRRFAYVEISSNIGTHRVLVLYFTSGEYFAKFCLIDNLFDGYLRAEAIALHHLLLRRYLDLYRLYN